MLAVLMGGGLVLFGIGGDVSGGLFDAFTRQRRGGSGNSVVEKRIERNEERLKARARRTGGAARRSCGDNYQLAVVADPVRAPPTFPEDGKDDLRQAGRLLGALPRRREGQAGRVARARGAAACTTCRRSNQPKDAGRGARSSPATPNDAQSYLLLVQYAALAGDKRTADLAAQKAVDLAPKNQRKQVEKKQAKQLQNGRPAAAGRPAGLPFRSSQARLLATTDDTREKSELPHRRRGDRRRDPRDRARAARSTSTRRRSSRSAWSS